jgi:hypothetical protein
LAEKTLFKPYPKQEEFVAAVISGKYSLLTYGGAMGGGKSYVCLAIAIMLCKFYPKSKWCVVRESLPTLKKTTLATFFKIAPTNFIRSYNQQDQLITFKNGSQLLFMAEDFAHDKEFDRFKGLEVNGFILEQIEELQEALLDVCFIRSGRHRIDPMPKPVIIANLNPTLRWPRKRIYDKAVNKTLPEDWYYLPAKISDNPALYEDSNYMKQLKNLDDLTRARLIDGDWNAFGIDKPYLYAFNQGKHVIPAYTVNPHLPLLCSFDFNKDPMTCLVAQKPSIKETVVFDEIMIPNGSSEEVCEYIIARYPHFKFKIEVTGDATGQSRTSMIRGNVNHYKIIKQMLELTDRQLIVPKVNTSHINSRVLCNSILQNASVKITKNCEATITDCIYAAVDDEGELVKTVAEGRHFFDGFRYLLEAAYPNFLTKPHIYQ